MTPFKLAVVAAALSLSTAALAAPAPAAPTPDSYRFTVVPGSPTLAEVIIRVDTASGVSALSAGGAALVSIADNPAPGPGDYDVTSWAGYDATGARPVWNASRLDRRSGRVWTLAFDGKTTASWTLVPGP
jgi:hypothetical protein